VAVWMRMKRLSGIPYEVQEALWRSISPIGASYLHTGIDNIAALVWDMTDCSMPVAIDLIVCQAGNGFGPEPAVMVLDETWYAVGDH
jgi:hypothetical protein